MNLYCIENLERGLYFLDGEWCEEPEWFEQHEALDIVRGHPLIAATPSPVAVRRQHFGPEDME